VLLPWLQLWQNSRPAVGGCFVRQPLGGGREDPFAAWLNRVSFSLSRFSLWFAPAVDGALFSGNPMINPLVPGIS